MKIAFTTNGNDLNALLDNRFGRAVRFLIYDTDSQSFSLIDNQQNLNAAQGAGVQSAETIARQGVQVLISGQCGPKAYRVLSSAGIKIYTAGVMKIAEALAQYQAGQLLELKSEDVAGHWI